MDTVSIPVTMQQQKESPLVEVVSDDNDLSPIHEVSHDGDEQSMEANNPMTYPTKEFTDKSSPFRYDKNPSYTRDSSPAQSEKNLQQTIKNVLQDKIS